MFIDCRMSETSGILECNKDYITDFMVDSFIKDVFVETIENTITLVRCVLVNNYVLFETSRAHSAKTYSERVGKEVCLHRIRERIRELLKFLLFTAKNGIGGELAK